MRQRWVLKGTELVPVDQEWKPEARKVALVSESVYDGLRATDGADISTKKKHRDYMKANDLALRSDYKETWAKAAKERAEGSPEFNQHRRECIERAWYERHKP